MKKIFSFLILIPLILGVSQSSVYASTDDSGTYALSTESSMSMEQFICNVIGFLTGGVGKALAAFACIGLSLTFLAGKVPWTLVLTFSLGMACIFGAPTLIKAFTGGAGACESK
jgi:type IV secretory pathway VirB2 component (pilin)